MNAIVLKQKIFQTLQQRQKQQLQETKLPSAEDN